MGSFIILTLAYSSKMAYSHPVILIKRIRIKKEACIKNYKLGQNLRGSLESKMTSSCWGLVHL